MKILHWYTITKKTIDVNYDLVLSTAVEHVLTT